MSQSGVLPGSDLVSPSVAGEGASRVSPHKLQSFRKILIGLAIVSIPGMVSVYLHPWLRQINIVTPRAIELQPNRMVQLARVNSLGIYVTNIETFVTPANEWPRGTPLRDTFIVEVPPREAGAPPPLDGTV